MPVIDIALLRGRTPEQRIHQCESHELIYDRTFVGGPRTDGIADDIVVGIGDHPYRGGITVAVPAGIATQL